MSPSTPPPPTDRILRAILSTILAMACFAVLNAMSKTLSTSGYPVIEVIWARYVFAFLFMQDFLLDVWRDSGASVLFVTHHIDEAVALADRVVVFTSRPGRIKTIVPIDLPRPRNLFSREAETLRIQLTDLLRDEVDRAFAEQEALASVL